MIEVRTADNPRSQLISKIRLINSSVSGVGKTL